MLGSLEEVQAIRLLAKWVDPPQEIFSLDLPCPAGPSVSPMFFLFDFARFSYSTPRFPQVWRSIYP